MKPPLFHVEQAVVCLQQPGGIRWYEEQAPKRGVIYHVREIAACGDEYGIRLKEIVNPHYQYLDFNGEVAFAERRFAPVEELPDEALAELLEEVFTPVHA